MEELETKASSKDNQQACMETPHETQVFDRVYLPYNDGLNALKAQTKQFYRARGWNSKSGAF